MASVAIGISSHVGRILSSIVETSVLVSEEGLYPETAAGDISAILQVAAGSSYKQGS